MALLFVFAGALGAHDRATRHSLELSAAGLFPLGGWKADEYSAGPGLHAGYEFRFNRHVAADAGWTGVWAPGTQCSRFGCEHPREEIDFLDFGLRGILPLAAGRAELSIGVGGGHIWFSSSAAGPGYYNDWLVQYSAKGTVALDRRRRIRIAFTVRAWRDVNRPIQQWLTTAAGISYSFGGRYRAKATQESIGRPPNR